MPALHLQYSINFQHYIDEKATLTKAEVFFFRSWNPRVASKQMGHHYSRISIPIARARAHSLLVLDDGGTLCHSDGTTWRHIENMRRMLGANLECVEVHTEELNELISKAYSEQTGHTESIVDSLELQDDVAEFVRAVSQKEDLLDGNGQSPVIQLVNSLIFEAVKADASDLHIQPYEDRLAVRIRVDGILFDCHELPKRIQDEVVSRIKVQGKMNIAEKRLPQDGRATVRVGDRVIDLRIASLPSNYGERVVVRLLDKSAKIYNLSEIGMNPDTHSVFDDLVHLEHGMILVTGPTGSGKSTTLYAALQAVNRKDRNVLTLEDPIEFEIPGVSQTQINTKKGMTFATGLRNVLRQDPDIIMIGEIRDQETAVMGIQSALTGHLVFSTLHTNDSASAVTRLLDLGIEPYLASSSLTAVLAQRLVRRVCKHCKHEREITKQEIDQLGEQDFAKLASEMVQCGEGCDQCRGTGYRGRLGIFELLTISDQIRSEIQSRSSAAAIRNVAMEAGMRLLRDDGIAKIRSGETTVEEVTRVTMNSTY